MGIRQDIIDSFKEFEFTKIDGQPTDENLNQLVRELTEAAASIPTTNGGGAHGHIGMIIPDTEYVLFSTGGAQFLEPTNPGPYPTAVDPDAAIRERQVAEHKAELQEFEMYCAVKIALRNELVKCIDEEWIKELKSETMGYNHRSPREMLDYLYHMGGDLDHMDIAELNQELLKPWDHVEAPATMFARGDKYERQLIKAGIAAQPAMRLAVALAAFQASGEYDAAIRDWETKPVADKTFKHFRPFIQREFTKRVKHDKTSAKSVGKGIANQAREEDDTPSEADQAAWALAEVASVMQAAQDKQMEKLLELFTKSMEAMKKVNSPAPTQTPSGGGGGTRTMKPTCPHCNIRHLNHDDCWDLEKNKAKRPANYKPAAQRIAERQAKASS
eukprot:CCRYP_017925-RA/>CCRYP_017925-RA protein AED:0.39 eAED:0.39 QI:0/-1/0/1/-1/1/1/0/386